MGSYVAFLSRLATLVAMISHGNTAGRLPFATIASCLLLPSVFYNLKTWIVLAGGPFHCRSEAFFNVTSLLFESFLLIFWVHVCRCYGRRYGRCFAGQPRFQHSLKLSVVFPTHIHWRRDGSIPVSFVPKQLPEDDVSLGGGVLTSLWNRESKKLIYVIRTLAVIVEYFPHTYLRERE